MADDFSFTPPNYQPFTTATGYGYDDWLAQLRDAFSIPSRGAGNIGLAGGNNLPRYDFGKTKAMSGSGFNAAAFLAPFLAQMQAGGMQGGGAGPAAPTSGLLRPQNAPVGPINGPPPWARGLLG